MKNFLCALLMLAGVSTCAHAGSCGIQQAVDDWKASDQTPAATEKVLAVLETNSPSSFYFCDFDEDRNAYEWIDQLIQNVQLVDTDFRLHNLRTRLWAAVHYND